MNTKEEGYESILDGINKLKLDLKKVDLDGKARKDALKKRIKSEKIRLEKVAFKNRSKVHGKRVADNPIEQPIFDLWNSLLIRHISKKYDGDVITAEHLVEINNIQHGLCFYTGLKYEFENDVKKRYLGNRSPLSASVDRIDSSVGYVTGNVVICAWFVNVAKNAWTIEAMKDLWRHLPQNDDILKKIKEYVCNRQIYGSGSEYLAKMTNKMRKQGW